MIPKGSAMKEIHLRQEVLNTVLAELLTARGIAATPEQILMHPEFGKKMPDVRFGYNGIRGVIECEIEGPQAEVQSLESARRRVEEGIASIALALVYPLGYATSDDVAHLKVAMQSSQTLLRVAVVTELESSPFTEGALDYICTIVHEAWQRLLQEDILSATVADIDNAVHSFSQAVAPFPGIAGKLAKCLGIQGAPDKKIESRDDD
jgi:hypothetical protein